jgi:hypothetical protein
VVAIIALCPFRRVRPAPLIYPPTLVSSRPWLQRSVAEKIIFRQIICMRKYQSLTFACKPKYMFCAQLTYLDIFASGGGGGDHLRPIDTAISMPEISSGSTTLSYSAIAPYRAFSVVWSRYREVWYSRGVEEVMGIYRVEQKYLSEGEIRRESRSRTISTDRINLGAYLRRTTGRVAAGTIPIRSINTTTMPGRCSVASEPVAITIGVTVLEHVSRWK